MRPRIALVTPSVNRRGGTEKVLSWLVEDLAREADVTLVCGDVAETETRGCRVVRLPMIGRPRLLSYLSFLIANSVWFALRRPRFDKVVTTGGDCFHADAVYAHFCCAAWSRRLAREPLLPGGGLRRRLANLHYRLFLAVAARTEGRIYRRGGEVIAVSQGTARELERFYGVAAGRIRVVPNAVDPRVRLDEAGRQAGRARVRAREGVAPNAVVVLFLAAGDWKRKGLGLLLEALAQLPGGSRPTLLVVGRDEAGFYERLAARLGVAEGIRFCGFRPDVESYYAAADVFVYPSSYEAFPLVVLEAAGAGLPLVVTRINGVEELVQDGRNGFLVAPDATEIADRLQRLVRDPGLRERMAAAAEADSRAYTREAVAGGFLRALEAVP